MIRHVTFGYLIHDELLCVYANDFNVWCTLWHAIFEVLFLQPIHTIDWVPKFKIGLHDLFNTPFWPIFIFFQFLASLTANPPAKFDVCSFTLYRDNRVSKNQSRSPDLDDATGSILYFCLLSLSRNLPAKFEVCSFSLSGYIKRFQNSKVGHLI